VPYDEAQINEIAIEDDDQNELALWQDEDLSCVLPQSTCSALPRKSSTAGRTATLARSSMNSRLLSTPRSAVPNEHPPSSQPSRLARRLRRVRRLAHGGFSQSGLRARRAPVERESFRPALARLQHRRSLTNTRKTPLHDPLIIIRAERYSRSPLGGERRPPPSANMFPVTHGAYERLDRRVVSQ
jgi:hypothetical protein